MYIFPKCIANICQVEFTNSISIMINLLSYVSIVQKTSICFLHLHLPSFCVITDWLTMILYINISPRYLLYMFQCILLQMVGSTALYLAGKAEETPCKLRDLINVSYNILNKDKPLIEIAKKYWDLRESIVKSELLFLRVLGFQVTVDNPHKVNKIV